LSKREKILEPRLSRDRHRRVGGGTNCVVLEPVST
jgi:hypothetical protein